MSSIKKIDNLASDIKQLIDDGRQFVSQTVNSTLTATYWNIGKRINDDALDNKRADYGKKVVQSLSEQLTAEYGKGWSIKQLRHCIRFSETFQDFEIVSALQRQFSWTHFQIQPKD